VNGRDACEALAARVGLAWRDGASRYRHGPVELAFDDTEHPITRGVARATFVDESYWELVGDPSRVHVLASSLEEGAARPQLFVRELERGRVFVSLLGHYTWTFDDPLFRRLLLRGFAWAARQPIARFDELDDIGARLASENAPRR